jgi:predicted nucleic acid-binding protein
VKLLMTFARIEFDSIHLASAMRLNGMDFEMITYDKRLSRVCELAGVKVISPN